MTADNSVLAASKIGENQIDYSVKYASSILSSVIYFAYKNLQTLQASHFYIANGKGCFFFVEGNKQGDFGSKPLVF